MFALGASHSNNVYAEYSLSFSSSGAQSIDVVPSANGVGTSISADTISVTTNCPSGYNMVIGTNVSNNNLYLNGDSSNNTSGTYFTPSNGTTALNNAANTWGYYFDSTNPGTTPTSNSTFLAVPTVGNETLVNTNSANSFNIYYGVAVGNNLTTGTYKMPDNGAIVYQLTMSPACLPYTVIFNPTSTAGGNTLTGTGTMSPQLIPADTSATLDENTFTAPLGYIFNGWNTAQDGTGITYTDGQTISSLASGNTTVTLYAQWKQVYLQDLLPSECTTKVQVILDKRDNTPYHVQRLADGNCWFLDNLALDPTALTQEELYGTDTEHLTNASNATLGYLKNGGDYFGSVCDWWGDRYDYR